jgi:low temperature requirement protein LtrA
MPTSAFERWYRPMVARDTDETNRSPTPLELLFDLCFVVAVSLASDRLRHAISVDEIGHGAVSFLLVFFAIWWAWVNFTWFASAYDTDDGLYRVTTLVQITGALILAAGIPRAFNETNFTVVVIGYVIMRLALVGQWLRAAWSDPARRVTALRFAAGVAIVEAAWVGREWLPGWIGRAGFVVIIIAELIVPIYAERAAIVTWHPVHIAERHGLFLLIVLSESVFALSTAFQVAFDQGGNRAKLFGLAGAGLVILFSLWWLYFDRLGQEVLASTRFEFVWGYGHYFIFASAAAVGAGAQLNVSLDEHATHASAQTVAYAMAVPVAVYLVTVWAVHRRPNNPELRNLSFLLAAVLVLISPLVPGSITMIAVVLAALVVVTT